MHLPECPLLLAFLEMECWSVVIQWENSAALPLHCWGGQCGRGGHCLSTWKAMYSAIINERIVSIIKYIYEKKRLIVWSKVNSILKSHILTWTCNSFFKMYSLTCRKNIINLIDFPFYEFSLKWKSKHNFLNYVNITIMLKQNNSRCLSICGPAQVTEKIGCEKKFQFLEILVNQHIVMTISRLVWFINGLSGFYRDFHEGYCFLINPVK